MDLPSNNIRTIAHEAGTFLWVGDRKMNGIFAKIDFLRPINKRYIL